MRFFEEQAKARRRTALLVILFTVSIALTVLVMDVVFGLAYGVVQWIGLDLNTPITQGLNTSEAPAEAIWQMLLRTWRFLVPGWLIWCISIAVLAVIVYGSATKMRELASGGPAVAHMLDAKPVVRLRAEPLERRLLNVVEEMAVAAGIPVPRVYVLDRAAGINALTAGFTPGDAVIIVTRGALLALERDELQGVVAHEISHVLNGDVRLNTWLIGLLAGIVSIGALGGFLLAGDPAEGESPAEVRQLMARAALGMPLAIVGGAGIFLLGLVLAILGGTGLVFARLIKATISREREFLADASAVRFTRNPDGLAGALARIEAHRFGSRLYHPQAEALSHMFFGASVLIRLEWLFATHPPVEERIARIAPGVHAERYLARPPRGEAEMIAEAIREAHDRLPQAGTVALAGADTAAQAVVDSVGNPSAEHAHYAASLLDSLAPGLRDALATAGGSKALVLALALAPEATARETQLAVLEKKDPLLAAMAREMAQQTPVMGAAYRLPIVELAVPALARLDPEERREFLSALRRVVDADGRLTPREFALFVLLANALQERPKRRDAQRFRTLGAAARDAYLVLALLACAAGSDRAAEAFRNALSVAGLPDVPMPDAATLSLDQVLGALARLNGVAPLAKPALIKGCVAAVRGPDGIRAEEAELLRTVGVAIDCPLPPLALKPQ